MLAQSTKTMQCVHFPKLSDLAYKIIICFLLLDSNIEDFRSLMALKRSDLRLF